MDAIKNNLELLLTESENTLAEINKWMAERI